MCQPGNPGFQGSFLEWIDLSVEDCQFLIWLGYLIQLNIEQWAWFPRQRPVDHQKHFKVRIYPLFNLWNFIPFRILPFSIRQQNCGRRPLPYWLRTTRIAIPITQSINRQIYSSINNLLFNGFTTPQPSFSISQTTFFYFWFFF